jgi:hypothetical protein
MSLRPEENITKILLSTPSYLVGEYKNEVFLLSIAIDRTLKRDDTLVHEYFIFAMKTTPIDRSPGAMIPDTPPQEMSSALT